MTLVHHNNARYLLAKGKRGTQAEPESIVVALLLEIAHHIAAIAHDVVAIHVACGVEFAHTSDIPVLYSARAPHDEIAHCHALGHLAGKIAIHRIIPVDEETRIRQTNLLHHTALEKATFETGGVHFLVAARRECAGRDGIRNTQEVDEVVLPVERLTVKVVATTLNNIESQAQGFDAKMAGDDFVGVLCLSGMS